MMWITSNIKLYSNFKYITYILQTILPAGLTSYIPIRITCTDYDI